MNHYLIRGVMSELQVPGVLTIDAEGKVQVANS